MDRPAIHDLPKALITERLRALGLSVESAHPSARFDFTIGSRTRVAVRVAFPSSSRRRVRVSKRCYNYVYRAWNFNFHHRGVVGERYTDFFVCVPLGTGRPMRIEDAFVIPWEALSGKTFYLPEARREYRGKFRAFQNAWEPIATAARSGDQASRAA
jgi:hypothetical protein